MDVLGDRVRQSREMLGLTREKLAEMLNISIEHISNIELKKRKMSIDLLVKMSKIFCVSTDYLLFGKDTQVNQNLTLTDMLSGLNNEERALAEQILKFTIRALRAGK